MKQIAYIIGLLLLPFASVKAQGYIYLEQPAEVLYTTTPVTHIQVHPNATYQNNSQFYNKDNRIDASKPYLTSNGEYIKPGYSNPVNRTKYNGFVPNEPELPRTDVEFSTTLPIILRK